MNNQVPSMPLGPYDPLTHQEVVGEGGGVDVYENQRGMDGHENDLRGRRIREVCFGMSFGKLLLLSKLRV